MSPVSAIVTLISGNGVAFFLRLLRNVLIARLISVEDYGIGSTFVVAVSLISMATNLNLGKMIIQARDEDRHFIDAVNGIVVARGVLLAAILYLTGGWMARLFGQPELAWAYQMVAVIPLTTSLRHLDMQLFSRSMNFRPAVASEVIAVAVTVVLAWILSRVFGDFRVMLAVLVAHSLISCVLTHVFARNPYRLAWDREVTRQCVRFGWPLLVGSMAVFATQQGDRIIISNVFGAYELGLFSAALTLIMPVVLQVTNIADQFFLPLLARKQDDNEVFDYRVHFALQATLCLGLIGMLGFCFLGAPVVVLIFGERYADAVPAVALAGTMFALQIPRGGVATASMARGDTMNVLVANLVRIAFLPIGIAVVLSGGGVAGLLTVGVLGQLAALATAAVLLRRWSGVGRFDRMRLPYGFALVSLVLMIAAIWAAPDHVVRPGLLGGLSVLAAIAAGLSCQTLLGEIRTRLKKRRG